MSYYALLIFVIFLKFCPPNSQRKYRDHAPTWHSTVISNGHHAEINVTIPPPHFCLMLAWGRNRGILQYMYSTAHSQLDKHVHVHATREWHGVHVRVLYATPMCVACCARIRTRTRNCAYLYSITRWCECMYARALHAYTYTDVLAFILNNAPKSSHTIVISSKLNSSGHRKYGHAQYHGIP